MKKISETATEEVFIDYFQGNQMRISRNKLSGKLFFNSDDVAKALGFRDHNDMIANPEIQARAIEYQKENGKPIFIERKSTNHIN